MLWLADREVDRLEFFVRDDAGQKRPQLLEGIRLEPLQ
jgi:hypothetical protein